MFDSLAFTQGSNPALSARIEFSDAQQNLKTPSKRPLFKGLFYFSTG
jgi:hypothetical protein